MERPTTQPQPCTDPNCREQHATAERIAMATSLCAERGRKLTTVRREVLELLWDRGRATGAYELIDMLKRRHDRPVAPPTVYRALEFLMSQRLVAKIESRNAYVPCAHPERKHDCLFLICGICGASTEFEDSRVAQALAEDAATLGYRMTRPVVEIEGACENCVASIPS